MSTLSSTLSAHPEVEFPPLHLKSPERFVDIPRLPALRPRPFVWTSSVAPPRRRLFVVSSGFQAVPVGAGAEPSPTVAPPNRSASEDEGPKRKRQIPWDAVSEKDRH
ncbi:MAG: hypothetical protein AAFU77_15035 [Myxococcota bacterium]